MDFFAVKEEINQNLSKEEIQSYNSLDSFAVKEEINEKLSNEEIQSYNCYLCDASFFQQKFLKFHFAYDHEGQNPWKCKICEKIYSKYEHLKRHVASVHEGNKILFSWSKRFSIKSFIKLWNLHLGQVEA